MSKNENKSKMYILIKSVEDGVDIGHAILAAAHASTSGYLQFIKNEGELTKDGLMQDQITRDWERESFRKVICKPTLAEFEKAKTYGENLKDYKIMVECGLGGMEVAIVVKPRDTNADISFNRFLKSLKLYK